MITIEIPVNGTSVEQLKPICEHFECTIAKGSMRDYYKVSTENPINLFWLGCNINHKLTEKI